MTFCGTIGRYDGKFLSLAMTCILLNDPLLEMEDARYISKKKKDKRRGEQMAVTPEGQYQMFPLTTKQRDEFEKFGKTLRYFLEVFREDEIKIKPKTERKLYGLDGWLAKLDWCDYEFYGFWFNIIRRYGHEKFEEYVDMVDKVGQGVPMDDYHPLIKFFSGLNSWALHEHESYRGGCF
jgi:hypothetical protein